MIDAVFRQAYGTNPKWPRLASTSSQRLSPRSPKRQDAPRAWQTWATSSASARRSVGPARRLPLAGFPGGGVGGRGWSSGSGQAGAVRGLLARLAGRGRGARASVAALGLAPVPGGPLRGGGPTP